MTGILNAMENEQIVLFADDEISWLQGAFARDINDNLDPPPDCQGGDIDKQIEQHLDLFIKARGELLCYTEPATKWIGSKLQSLGLDPEAYERKRRKVISDCC